VKFFKVYIFVALLSFCYANTLEKVSLQYQWINQFQFAGYIVAKEKGFYEAAGLDVELRQWHHEIDMSQEVLEKRADFAVARPTVVIDASQAKEVVALYATFQNSPLVYVALEKSNIKTIQDFKNKRIMTSNDMNLDASLIAMTKSEGIDIDSLVLQKHSFNVQDLIDNNTDLMLSYVGNEPYMLMQKGHKSVVFDPKDYGFDFYNDILITSKSFLEQNPQTVEKFVKASLKGWEYAFDNIAESAQIIYDKYNTQNKSISALIYEGEKLREYAYTQNGELGQMEQSKFERIYDIYKILGLAKGSVDFKEFLYTSPRYKLGLNDAQSKYLNDKKEVLVCHNNDFAPIEFVDETQNVKGIAIDVVKLLQESLNVKFRFVNTENWAQSQEFLKEKLCDLLPSVYKTQARQNYANFTDPYLNLDLAIVTTNDKAFTPSLEVIADEKGARKRGSGIVDILQNRYGVTNLVQTDTIKDSFDYVSQNKVYYTVATLPVISYYMQKYDYDNLQISGYLPQKYELAMAIRNDDAMLLSIIQKALDAIEPEKYNDINTRWTKIIVDKQVTYAPYSKYLYLLGAVALFFIVSNLLLRRARKKAEKKAVIKSEALEKLNLALEIANLATFEYDILKDQIHLDKKLQSVLAIKEGASIEKFISLVPKVEQKQLEFEINEAKFTDSPVLTEHYLMTQEGNYNYVNMNFKVIKRTLKGAPMKMVATILDLTKFKQMEDELFKAKESAEKAAQSKANFLANMSHELLTPLNVIQGMSDLIKKGTLSKTQQRDLDKLQSAAQTLQSIINDILDFSSLESGDYKIRRAIFNLKDLIIAMMQKYEKQVDEKGLAIELKYDDSVAQNFCGDSAKITQILDNLITNAIKFTEEGKITVSVSSEKDSVYQIGVHDTGIGLNRDEIESIFESFTQIDASDSRKYEGVGLGLALVKQLVRLLDAQITVRSKVGIGSSFTVELPLTQTAQTAKTPPIQAKSSSEKIKKTAYNEAEILHLWDCLKEAVLTRRPKNYEPLIEKISAIALSQEDSKKLETIKHYLKEYDFAKTVKIIEGSNGEG